MVVMSDLEKLPGDQTETQVELALGILSLLGKENRYSCRGGGLKLMHTKNFQSHWRDLDARF